MTTLRRNVLSVYAIISRTGLIIIASSRYYNIVVTARLNIDAAPATRTFQSQNERCHCLDWVVVTHPVTTYQEEDSILSPSSHRRVLKKPTAEVPVKCPHVNTSL
jgi:hypothetical protein